MCLLRLIKVSRVATEVYLLLCPPAMISRRELHRVRMPSLQNSWLSRRPFMSPSSRPKSPRICTHTHTASEGHAVLTSQPVLAACFCSTSHPIMCRYMHCGACIVVNSGNVSILWQLWRCFNLCKGECANRLSVLRQSHMSEGSMMQ